MNATIPMAGDLAALVGPCADQVENRSLLLDKFAFHKKWPEAIDPRGQPIKWDDASRWSFVRVASGGSDILRREADQKKYKASGRNVEPANATRLQNEAEVARVLSNVSWDTPAHQQIHALRAQHTRRFIGLFESAYGSRCAVITAELGGRLAINLAGSLIQNAGMSLDRLFGLPFIPGSAVKGLCRHVALAELKSASADQAPFLINQFVQVFGCSDTDFRRGALAGFAGKYENEGRNQRGAVCFLDAFPLNEAKIVVDLTNVHYPDYYRTGQSADLRNERPQPNPFPVVEAGSQFGFCLILSRPESDPQLLAVAQRWLERALTENGIGAKTASGYGWFILRPELLCKLREEEQLRAAEQCARAAAERKLAADRIAEAERAASLSPMARAAEALLGMKDEEFANFAKDLSLKERAEQEAFLHLLRDNREKRDRWKVWRKKKPELAASILKVCTELNLPPLP